MLINTNAVRDYEGEILFKKKKSIIKVAFILFLNEYHSIAIGKSD